MNIEKLDEIGKAAEMLNAINQEMANRVESITKDRDQLRAEVERLRSRVEWFEKSGGVTAHVAYFQMERQRDQWREVASRLAKVLSCSTWLPGDYGTSLQNDFYCTCCQNFSRNKKPTHHKGCAIANALAAYERLCSEQTTNQRKET